MPAKQVIGKQRIQVYFFIICKDNKNIINTEKYCVKVVECKQLN